MRRERRRVEGNGEEREDLKNGGREKNASQRWREFSSHEGKKGVSKYTQAQSRVGWGEKKGGVEEK